MTMSFILLLMILIITIVMIYLLTFVHYFVFYLHFAFLEIVVNGVFHSFIYLNKAFVSVIFDNFTNADVWTFLATLFSAF